MDRNTEAPADDPHVRNAEVARLEAGFFSAEEPLSPRRLMALAELPDLGSVTRGIEELRSAYDSEGSPFQIVELALGYQLLTRSEYFPWLARLRQSAGEAKLGGTLLETVAIIAYRQPIMRADLEAIRGVHCGDALRELLERGLVRIAGRDNSLGRPILYGTTKKFLQVFGLRELGDLPPLEGKN